MAAGGGTFEDNEMFAHGMTAFEIREAGPVTAARNTIRDGKQNGLHIAPGGKGIFSHNVIRGNKGAGIEVKSEHRPRFEGNRIEENGIGIRVTETGSGDFARNKLIGNKRAAWVIAGPPRDRVTREANTPNA
jgi:parallel beta-helix repeat protein